MRLFFTVPRWPISKPRSKELIREEYLKKIESKLQEVVEFSKIADVSSDQLVEMLKSYLEGKYE